MTDDSKTTPAVAPGLDLDAAEKRAAGFRGRFRAMSYDSGEKLLEFVSADRDIGDDVSDIDEIARFACDDETQRAIVDTLNAAPALIAEVRALRVDKAALVKLIDENPSLRIRECESLRARLAEAKRLGLEFVALHREDGNCDGWGPAPGMRSKRMADIAAALEAL